MNVHVLFGADNDSYAFQHYPCLSETESVHQQIVPKFENRNLSEWPRYSACGELLEKNVGLVEDAHVSNVLFDVSSTYDGIEIVSERFKIVCEKNKLKGLVFTSLNNHELLYAIRAIRIVQFDTERRATRFGKYCESCRQYSSVAGATPAYLKKGESIDDMEFVRTDIEFGSGDEKSPLLLCGESARQVLLASDLRGLEVSSNPC